MARDVPVNSGLDIRSGSVLIGEHFVNAGHLILGRGDERNHTGSVSVKMMK
jgi:hypothetical protein